MAYLDLQKQKRQDKQKEKKGEKHSNDYLQYQAIHECINSKQNGVWCV